MAADTVEGESLFGERLFRAFVVKTEVLLSAAVQSGDSNPGNLLLLLVFGGKFDFLDPADMVVMDAVEDLAANFHSQGDLFSGVLLVGVKIRALHQLGAKEFPRPMA